MQRLGLIDGQFPAAEVMSIEHFHRLLRFEHEIFRVDGYAVVRHVDGPEERKKVKTLTPSQIANAFGKSFIAREEAMRGIKEELA